MGNKLTVKTNMTMMDPYNVKSTDPKTEVWLNDVKLSGVVNVSWTNKDSPEGKKTVLSAGILIILDEIEIVGHDDEVQT